MEERALMKLIDEKRWDTGRGFVRHIIEAGSIKYTIITARVQGTEPEEHFMHEMYITRAYAAQAGKWRFIKEVSNWNLIDALRTHNAAINSLDDKADANN